MKSKVRRIQTPTKIKTRKQRSAAHKLCHNFCVRTVRLDSSQMGYLANTFNHTLNTACEDLSNIMKKEEIQRNDLFSCIVRLSLSALFGLSGLLLFITIVLNWRDLWIGGLQNFGVIILLLYCAIFVVLGADIWRERDRNYLVSIFSALVAFVAMVITLLNYNK